MPRVFLNSTIHIVVPGDTLGAIAAANGKTLAQIMEVNPGLLDHPDLIAVGMSILIPGDLAPAEPEPAVSAATQPAASTAPEQHVVVSGDSLGAIASGWGLGVDEVARFNGIANPDQINVGQVIRRPGSTGTGGGTTSLGGGGQLAAASGLHFASFPVGCRGNITGGYKANFGTHPHRGIDIGGQRVGTPIVAPAAGIATPHHPGDGWGDGSFGICVVLEHTGTGWWTIYAHMNDAVAVAGQQVQAGDLIGHLGFTGMVDPPGVGGAHCHWQVSNDPGFPPTKSSTADPLSFL